MAEARRPITAADVERALKAGPFAEDIGYVWLDELRDPRTECRADALVVQVWKSRGISFTGIEIKVDRRDWRRELKKPSKADAIAKWCDAWYLATPPGVIEPAELPEAWGHFVVGGEDKLKARMVKQAPKLSPEPLSPAFVASILRNYARQMKAALERGRLEGFQNGENYFGAAAINKALEERDAAKTELRNVQRALDWAKRDIASLKHEREEFERHSGVRLVAGYQQSVAKQFKVAEVLARVDPAYLADRLDELAVSLRAVVPPEEMAVHAAATEAAE